MTRNDLYEIMRNYVGTDAEALHAENQIWGQPFDGETEKIKPSTEEAEARVAELREQMSALMQVQEVSKAEARVAELREQMSALAQAHEIWLRDAAMKEERR